MKPARAPEIAAKFGFTTRYWTRLASEGKIPCAYQLFGKRSAWLFDRGGFDKWAAEHGYQNRLPPAPVVRRPIRKATPTDVVYLLYSGGLIKIGVSSNYAVRSRSFRTASPLPIQKLLEFSGGFSLETELHKKFESSYSHGEWFHLTPDLRGYIIENGAGELLAHGERGFRLWAEEHCK